MRQPLYIGVIGVVSFMGGIGVIDIGVYLSITHRHTHNAGTAYDRTEKYQNFQLHRTMRDDKHRASSPATATRVVTGQLPSEPFAVFLGAPPIDSHQISILVPFGRTVLGESRFRLHQTRFRRGRKASSSIQLTSAKLINIFKAQDVCEASVDV